MELAINLFSVKWTGQINYWASKADNFTRRNNVITLLRYILNSTIRKWLNVQFLYSEMYFVMDYIFLSLCIHWMLMWCILRNTTFLPKAAFPGNHIWIFVFFFLFVYLFAVRFWTVVLMNIHHIINIKYIRLIC